MKKLILITAITLLSHFSMAMGFPHNTYHQQQQLNQSKNLVTNTSLSFQESFETVEVEQVESFSFVEMISDFILKFFSSETNPINWVALNSHEMPINHFDSAMKNEDTIIG